MKTSTIKEGQNGTAINAPTVEMVRTWVKRDAQAAVAFLTMMLSHPEILEIVADEFFAKSQTLEQVRKDNELLEKAEASESI